MTDWARNAYAAHCKSLTISRLAASNQESGNPKTEFYMIREYCNVHVFEHISAAAATYITGDGEKKQGWEIYQHHSNLAFHKLEHDSHTGRILTSLSLVTNRCTPRAESYNLLGHSLDGSMGALQGPGQVLVHAVFNAVEESLISQSFDEIWRTNIPRAFSKCFSCPPFNSLISCQSCAAWNRGHWIFKLVLDRVSVHFTILSAVPIFSSFRFFTTVVPRMAPSCVIRQSMPHVAELTVSNPYRHEVRPRDFLQAFDLPVAAVFLLTAVFEFMLVDRVVP